MPTSPHLTRRTLLATSATSLAALATAGTGAALAAGRPSTLPPELVLAGAPDDYVGYAPIPRYFP